MDLKVFYMNNIKESEYHYRFYKSIKSVDQVYDIFGETHFVEDYGFEVFDVEEAITKFRELCQPEVSFDDSEKKCWFYLVTYYLFKLGYVIKEFPRLLAHPPTDPSEFTYRQIRNKIIADGNDENGTVRYAMRRKYIANLSFELRSEHIELEESVEQKFKDISNRSASFNTMSTDEKLAEIANLLENMLKKNGQFVSLDYSSVCFDYVTNDMIKNYRKKMQCFRHSTEEAIAERDTLTENQKGFLIDYGLTIVNAISKLL